MSALMKPSEQVKAAGIKSLACIEQMTGVNRWTLNNWHRDRPALFAVIVAGCAAKLKERQQQEIKATND